MAPNTCCSLFLVCCFVRTYTHKLRTKGRIRMLHLSSNFSNIGNSILWVRAVCEIQTVVCISHTAHLNSLSKTDMLEKINSQPYRFLDLRSTMHWWRKVQMSLPCLVAFPTYLYKYKISKYSTNAKTLSIKIH